MAAIQAGIKSGDDDITDVDIEENTDE